MIALLPPCFAEETKETDAWKKPIKVSFEIPYFTVSGIQVRYLRIMEKSGYQVSNRCWCSAYPLAIPSSPFLIPGMCIQLVLITNRHCPGFGISPETAIIKYECRNKQQSSSCLCECQYNPFLRHDDHRSSVPARHHHNTLRPSMAHLVKKSIQQAITMLMLLLLWRGSCGECRCFLTLSCRFPPPQRPLQYLHWEVSPPKHPPLLHAHAHGPMPRHLSLRCSYGQRQHRQIIML